MVCVCPPHTSISLSCFPEDSLAISSEMRFASSGSRYSSTYFILISVLLCSLLGPGRSLVRLASRGPFCWISRPSLCVDHLQQCVIDGGLRLLDARNVVAGNIYTKIYCG